MREKGVRVMRDGREIGERCVCASKACGNLSNTYYITPDLFLASSSTQSPPPSPPYPLLSSYSSQFLFSSRILPPSSNLSAPICHTFPHSTSPHQLPTSSFIQPFHTLHSTLPLPPSLNSSTFLSFNSFTPSSIQLLHTLLHSTPPHPPPFNLPHPPPFNSSTPFFHFPPVFFRTKELEIYPVEGSKPPQGKGLNRRAQVTLERAFPSDKNTGKLITVGWDG